MGVTVIGTYKPPRLENIMVGKRCSKKNLNFKKVNCN